MINATVSGNLGKDAELRDAGQSRVLSFSVASSAKVKGEKTTTWVRCSLWGKRGEALAQYLTKGSKVCVAGELSTREYNGSTYLEMRVSELDMMGGRGASGGGVNAPPSDEPGDDLAGADDIPF